MSTLTTTRLGRAVALMAVTGSLAAMPAAASAAEQPLARAGVQPAALSAASALAAPPVAVRSTTTQRKVRTKWGFNAQLWSYTVADPWGVHRVYFYRKCNPSYPTRWLTMKSGWIYRTYACWAKLA